MCHPGVARNICLFVVDVRIMHPTSASARSFAAGGSFGMSKKRIGSIDGAPSNKFNHYNNIIKLVKYSVICPIAKH